MLHFSLLAASHLKLGRLGMDGMLGILGMEGKLFRSLSSRLDFFLAAQTRAASRATMTTVTPIAIPTEMEGHGQRRGRRQFINNKMKFASYKLTLNVVMLYFLAIKTNTLYLRMQPRCIRLSGSILHSTLEDICETQTKHQSCNISKPCAHSQ